MLKTLKISVFVVGAWASLALVGCATTHSAKKLPPANDTGLHIIDAHIHTRFTNLKERNTGILVSREELLKEMHENGVVGAIAHTGANGTGYQADLKQEGIISCFGLDGKPDPKVVEAALKSGKFSCIKIYLGYVHQFANDPAYRPIYKLAEKYDVAVVFHTGDTYDVNGKVKYSDPLTIDEVAVDFRKVRFVIAHLGNPWVESAAEVAYKNPNVWVDGSAFMIGNMDELSKEDVDEYVVKPLAWAFGYMESPTKLMYGTDWPLNDMGGYIRAFKRAIPQKYWPAVFHDNAVKVFKITGPAAQ